MAFKMVFEIEGKCVITLEHTGGQTSALKSVDFNLDISNNMNKSMYLDDDGLPTKVGTKALTQAFVQGLVGNIHQAHQNNFWDSAQHLRYIISELERAFIEVPHLKKTTFTR